MRTACVNGAPALFLAFVVALVPPVISRADVNRPVIEAGKRATALVEIYEGDKLKGWASAFCIDKSGIFITNHHVAVTGTKSNKLTLVLDAGTPNQKSLKATVLKADAESDLAVLRADQAGPYESLELSDPASIRGLVETTPVIVFGYPLGGSLALAKGARPEATISTSRITSLRHDHGELQLIQLDGSINHGNSGGPVVDERGKVIAIISSGITGAQIAFAVPANRLGPLLVQAQVKFSARTPDDPAVAFTAVLTAGEAQIPNTPGPIAVPDASARTAARKIIHDLFAAQFADTGWRGQRVLGSALLARGIATADDPAGAYELLDEAAEVAVEGRDVDTAMKAINELGRRFNINATTQRVELLRRLASKVTTPLDQASLAAHALLTAQVFIHRDQCEQARPLLEMIRAAASASSNVPIQKQTREKLLWIESVCAQNVLAASAIKKLATSPNDPEANLVAGRFQCFYRNDFDKGLPLLAKGADPALKAAASGDLAKPADGNACKEAGDRWWDQSARESKDVIAADTCKARAAYWYRQGVDRLTGLSKMVVQQRLASLAAPAESAIPVKTLPAGEVNLLAAFDLTKDIESGTWERVAQGLTVQATHEQPTCDLLVTQKFPAEYDLHLAFTCTKTGSDNQFIVLKIPVGEKICRFGLQSDGSSYFGFWTNGQSLRNSKYVVKAERVATADASHHLLLKVRLTGVDGYLDDAYIYRCPDLTKLAPGGDKQLLSVVKAAFVFTEMTLTPAGEHAPPN